MSEVPLYRLPRMFFPVGDRGGKHMRNSHQPLTFFFITLKPRVE